MSDPAATLAGITSKYSRSPLKMLIAAIEINNLAGDDVVYMHVSDSNNLRDLIRDQERKIIELTKHLNLATGILRDADLMDIFLSKID